MTAERERLREARDRKIAWKKWGPYLSERQWGTVREDYSVDGKAWNYFSHDQARSRAYRWGEDGLAGISDDQQRLCFALALWNGSDPFLKERLYGVTGHQGNHGEDVKEYYFYLDSTPTHSYMKYLYKYPQAAFPYADLVAGNRARNRHEPEYELLDTGIFDEDRYFDVFVEYAKAAPDDLLIQISLCNRGPGVASLRVLPTLWFRNTWSWSEGVPRPLLTQGEAGDTSRMITAAHHELGEYSLVCEGGPQLLFVDNETNARRLFNSDNRTAYVKDGINDYIVSGRQDAVNPGRSGTRAAADYSISVGPGETQTIRLRLVRGSPGRDSQLFGGNFRMQLALRKAEADEFYQALAPDSLGVDERRVMRQALAGMLWSKQFYYYDVKAWIEEHGGNVRRNSEWSHIKNADVISMPDKWEYPWYAVWDLAFHTAPLGLVDADFAKQQLSLFLEDRYLHPDGRIPAYEWNFSDVNPPVHAIAVEMIYSLDKARHGGRGDIGFLGNAFDRLLRNFRWWSERKDPGGRNVFEGGFLGLDNIGVFDRSTELPTGGRLEQADGTAWMTLFAQSMLEIALELARHDSAYEDRVLEAYDRFLAISAAMDKGGGDHCDDMWDEEDGFFYDVLRLPDGRARRLKLRSLVGLLPLCAVTVIEPDDLENLPGLKQKYLQDCELRAQKQKAQQTIADPDRPGVNNRHLLAVLDENKLRRVLAIMLDENEFLGAHGIRSLSRYHAANPYRFTWDGQEYRVAYTPADSDTAMFGGNSNWRGPVWMPVNTLILRALLHLYTYYGDDFSVECPTGSGRLMNLYQVAEEIAQRLMRIFLRNEQGERPVYGGTRKFQTDPHWRDYILFYEYFHGDNGAGIGASHQTGWTGTVATLLSVFGSLTAEELLKDGMDSVTEVTADTNESVE